MIEDNSSINLEAYKTLTEASEELGIAPHVLRFWEGKFPFFRPVRRMGIGRFYRQEDMALLRGIKRFIQDEGHTIRSVQRIIKEQGVDFVRSRGKLLPISDAYFSPPQNIQAPPAETQAAPVEVIDKKEAAILEPAQEASSPEVNDSNKPNESQQSDSFSPEFNEGFVNSDNLNPQNNNMNQENLSEINDSEIIDKRIYNIITPEKEVALRRILSRLEDARISLSKYQQ